MAMRNAEKWVREFDVFSKVDPTAPRVKTVSSGIVSILCFLLLGYLFVQEVREYHTIEVISEVSVDTVIRREIDSLNVSLIVEFPNLLCDDFGLDALDHMGMYLHDASGPDGSMHKFPSLDASYDAILSPLSPLNLSQRPKQGGTDVKPEKKGCTLSGYLSIKMLRGLFQIGSRRESDFALNQLFSMGHGHDHGHEHVIPERAPFNVTHRIRSLSFGLVLPGAERPLEGVQAIMAEGENNQYTYFLQVVPVIRQYANGERVRSYRYAFTSHVESRLNALPSVTWKYDFSAYEMTHREVPKSFAHFITRCCAVIGGAFVVFGLLSVAASHLENAAKKSK